MTAASLKIRASNVTDAAAVSRLLEASYSVLLPRWYDEAQLVQILPLIIKANPLLLQSGTFYIAEAAGGALAGCGGWSLKRPGNKGQTEHEGDIRHFATHPDWLRRGIGGDILRQCLEDAIARKLRYMNCYSALGAETFYGSFGFSIIKRIDVPMKKHLSFPAILMRKELR